MSSSKHYRNGHTNGHANGHSNGYVPAHTPNGLRSDARPGAEENSMLRQTLGLLWQGKWLLLGVLAVVVAGTAAYTYTRAPQYETSSLLLVKGKGSVMPQFGRGGFSMGQSRSLANEMLILRQSRLIADRVANRLHTMESAPATGERLDILYNTQGQQIPEQYLARRVQGRVRVYPAGRDVDAIQIVGMSTVPGEATLIANLYAEEYIAYTKERSRLSLEASTDFLVSQESKLESEVRDVEDRIQDYIRENEAVALDRESNRAVERIVTLETRRGELEIQRDMNAATIQTLEGELSSVEPELAKRLSANLTRELQAIQNEKTKLELRVDQIKLKNPELAPSGDSPEARSLRQTLQRIADLKARSDSLADTYVAEALETGGTQMTIDGRGLPFVADRQQQLMEAQMRSRLIDAQIAAVSERIGEAEATLQKIPQQSMELARLERERRMEERLYMFIREKLQEARMAKESEVGYAEVIRPAGIPRIPVRPTPQRNLTLALIIGLLLGGGLVYLRDHLDTRIRQPEDLHKRGRNIIGVVPSMKRLIASDFGNQKHIVIDDQRVSTSLVMLTSPMSAPAESYRRIRANIQFSRPDADVRTILVTSPDKGEGKSTTSANLSLAMASAGKDTLIIDADLRRPRLQELFDVHKEPGLSQVLFDEVEFSRSMCKTGIDHLYFLPAGVDVPNPAELLGSQRMKTFLDEMREEFDIVIVDTPPILIFSDALPLSTKCDGVVLVAAANETDARAFDHAAEMLYEVGAPMLGGVLNRFIAEGSGYNYGYDYGYVYSYRRTAGEYYGKDKKKSGIKAWLTS